MSRGSRTGHADREFGTAPRREVRPFWPILGGLFLVVCRPCRCALQSSLARMLILPRNGSPVGGFDYDRDESYLRSVWRVKYRIRCRDVAASAVCRRSKTVADHVPPRYAYSLKLVVDIANAFRRLLIGVAAVASRQEVTLLFADVADNKRTRTTRT